MRPGGSLAVANLGDSGVRLIRDSAVVYASTAQQHSFNMPYQLSHPSIMESPDDADAAEVRDWDAALTWVSRQLAGSMVRMPQGCVTWMLPSLGYGIG